MDYDGDYAIDDGEGNRIRDGIREIDLEARVDSSLCELRPCIVVYPRADSGKRPYALIKWLGEDNYTVEFHRVPGGYENDPTPMPRKAAAIVVSECLPVHNMGWTEEDHEVIADCEADELGGFSDGLAYQNERRAGYHDDVDV